ncbi:hypothetical protein Tco_0277351 [Tanacetum coccineum]
MPALPSQLVSSQQEVHSLKLMQTPSCSLHLTHWKEEWSKQVQESLVFPLQMHQWVDEEEVAATEWIRMLSKYPEHQMRLLEEVEVVAMMVESQEEFLVRHVSFFSSCKLHLRLIEVDLSDHALRTSPEHQTNLRGFHGLRWSYLRTSINAEFPSYQQILRFSNLYNRDPCLSNLSSRAKLLCIKSAICYSSSPMRRMRIGSAVLYYGGGGRDVAVVIALTVAVDVGSGA